MPERRPSRDTEHELDASGQSAAPPGSGSARPEPTLLFGKSKAMKQLQREAIVYASIDDPLLLMGPPGSGKTELARYIHGLSGRSGRFVACPVPSIPPNLEQTHLAGHVRGAFTGALDDHPGVLRRAHGGTVLFDEIGLATPVVQAILLHVVQYREVFPVGGRRSIPVDVRLIAATNADLDAMVRAGTFRRDVLDRFGFAVLDVPPLEDRRGVILPLMDYYLAEEAARLSRPAPLRYSDGVRDCLLAAPWAGNVREVRALATYVVLHTPPGAVIDTNRLPRRFVVTLPERVRSASGRPIVDRVRDALASAEGNKSRAAEALGITRRHVHRILSRPRIEPSDR